MPGPIGVGKKILRTVARRRIAKETAKDTGAKREARRDGRSLADDFQDINSLKKFMSSLSAPKDPYFNYQEAGIDSYYQMALELCGNAGQEAIIKEMTPIAFESAADAHMEGGDAIGELIALCPHPEAVELILEEVGSVIADDVESSWA